MIFLWLGFIALIIFLLVFDLGVLNRKAHEIGTKEALKWTLLWVSVSLLFNVAIYFLYQHHVAGIGLEPGREIDGKQAALQYLTGYLVEYSLSIDNIFVIALIFTYFAVPRIYQHRTLFWGIVGAQIMRGAMIGGGIALIRKLDWMIYVFGALLLFTAFKLLAQKNEEIEPEKNPLLKFARRFFRVLPDFEGERFFSRLDGKLAVTPLFLVLLVIESTDVMFAVDSIPAIFAVTLDPFIVFSSNMFAILGLRSLYFALAAMMGMFRYLKYSIVLVLAFVGVKMLVSHFYHIHALASLGVIAALLAGGIAASLIKDKRDKPAGDDAG